MSENNVQSLYKKKRGRPKSPFLELTRRQYAAELYSSRQSIHNKHDMLLLGGVALGLGLVENIRFRDKATGKRMDTKLAVLWRFFGREFFEAETGKQWLMNNWQAIVELKTAELIQWVKEQREKTKE